MSNATLPPLPGGLYADKATSLLAGTWILTAIAVSVLSLRIYTRVRIARAYGADDWVMLVGTTLNVLYSIFIAVCVANGTGRHIAYLAMTKTMPQLEHLLLLLTICQAIAVHSFTVTKLSIGLLLCRVFAPSKLMRIFILTIPCVLICVAIATSFVVFYQCDPIAGQWTPSLLPVTKCWSPYVYIRCGYALGTISAFIDIFFGLYPLAVLANLRMNVKKRAGLAGLFALGLVAAAFTIYKTTLLPSLAQHTDITYQICDLLMWTSVESNIVIIGACLPTLIPLFRRVTERKTPSPSSGGNRESRNYQNLEAGVYKEGAAADSHNSGTKNSSFKRPKDPKMDISLMTFERGTVIGNEDETSSSEGESGNVIQTHGMPTVVEESEARSPVESKGSVHGDVGITTTYVSVAKKVEGADAGAGQSHKGVVPDNWNTVKEKSSRSSYLYSGRQ